MRIAMDAKTKKQYIVTKHYHTRGMFEDRVTHMRYDMVKVYI